LLVRNYSGVLQCQSLQDCAWTIDRRSRLHQHLARQKLLRCVAKSSGHCHWQNCFARSTDRQNVR
jgi:hypothetical protein